MKSKTITLIILVASLTYCSLKPLRQLGRFQEITDNYNKSSYLRVDQSIKSYTHCTLDNNYYHMDENFINNILEEMVSGDTSIIGFRDFQIEFKMFLLGAGIMGFGGIFCITFSGYAIREKESLK